MENNSVICDNNVLYYIASHGKLSELVKYNLHISYLTFLEIISSKNTKEHFGLVKGVVKLIDNDIITVLVELPTELVLETGLGVYEMLEERLPIEATLKELLNKRLANNEDFIKQSVEVFRQANSFDDLPIGFNDLIASRYKATTDLANHMMSAVETIRENENVKGEKLNNEWLSWIVSETINHLLEDLKHQLSGVDFEDFNEKLWSSPSEKLHFGLDCWARYFWGVVSHKAETAKINSNDYVDYFNIFYCSTGSKYLSCDKKVARILRESAFTNKDTFLLSEMDIIIEGYKELNQKTSTA